MKKLAILGEVKAVREVLEALLNKGKDCDADVFARKVQTGEEIDCVDKIFAVQNVAQAKAENYDLAVFVGDEQLAREYAHKWAKAGVKIINATDALSDYAEIPYVIDKNGAVESVVNVPHGLSLLIAKAVEPLKNFCIESLRFTLLVGADIAGQDGMSELYNHTRCILMNDNPDDKKIFPKTLAFNVIPQAGSFIGEETEYEWQLAVDLKRVLAGEVKIHANCAIAPVFVGAGAFVSVKFKRETTPEDALAIWKKTKGILVVNSQKDGGYAALTDVQGEYDVFISRVRQDESLENAVSFWTAGDEAKIMAATISDLIVKMLKKEMK